ncbi:MAG: TolC family protein [Myxococcota bacterium]
MPHRLRSCAATARLAALVATVSLLGTSVHAAPEVGPTEPAATAEPDPPKPAPRPAEDVPQPTAATPDPAQVEGLARGSAFALPAADRLDPYGPRPAGVPRLSHDQILRYALTNPLIDAADAKVDAMKAQVRKAKFLWLPIIETVTTLSPGANVECDDLRVSLDGTGAVGAPSYDDFQFQWCRSGADPNLDLNTVQGYFTQLGRAGVRVAFDAKAVFPIFTFGKIRNAKRLAKAGLALAELEKLQTQQETIKLVLQAHTTLMLARESQVILRDAKEVVDKALARVEGDLGGGGDEEDWDADPDDTNPDRDPNDLLRVQLAEVEVEGLMREALRAEALALAALWDLAGSAAPAGFDVREDHLEPFVLEGGRKSLEEYKRIAIRERPEAHMARAGVEAREAQEKLARAAFLPDLGLAVGVGFAFSNAVDREMNQIYYQDNFNYSRVTAALALRWRWDFHNSAFDLQKARAELRMQEYQREAAELYLGQDVTIAYQDVVEADHRIDLARRATELNWQLVISLEQRDTVSDGGNTNELLRILKNWYQKRFEEAEAIHAHNEAVARLARATGTPLIARSPAAPQKPKTASSSASAGSAP